MKIARNNHMRQRRAHGRSFSRGFTLVELMVAMLLGFIVAAAGVAALIIGRQGYTSVDAATQLRETGRFAANAVEQAALQTGFQNTAYGMFGNSLPTLRGYSNALVSPAMASLPLGLAHDSRLTSCGVATDTTCANGSDVLVVNFWGASRNGVADGSMVDCAGFAEPENAGTAPGAYSIISVATGSAAERVGEPALSCTYRDPVSNVWTTVPIAQGVESFRVLYGVYGLTKNTCAATPATPTTAVTASTAASGAAANLQPHVEAYFTAKEMDGASGYCPNNWTYVRALRIGLLVRGPVGSAQTNLAKVWNLFQSNSQDLFALSANTLSTAADNRLRQQLVFTVHVRNAL